MIRLTIKCSVDDTPGIEAALDACVGSLDYVDGYTFAVFDDVSGELRDEIVHMARNVYEDYDIEIGSDAEITSKRQNVDRVDEEAPEEDHYWIAARLLVRMPAKISDYARGYAAGLKERKVAEKVAVEDMADRNDWHRRTHETGAVLTRKYDQLVDKMNEMHARLTEVTRDRDSILYDRIERSINENLKNK